LNGLQVAGKEHVIGHPSPPWATSPRHGPFSLPPNVASAFVVLAAVEDANDYDLRPLHLERDRSPPLEAHRADAGADIVASGTALGKGFERPAGCFDPVDIGSGNCVIGFVGNVAIEAKQVSFGERPEAELKLFHSGGLSIARRDVRAGA
jgi:hypothetical protein